MIPMCPGAPVDLGEEPGRHPPSPGASGAQEYVWLIYSAGRLGEARRSETILVSGWWPPPHLHLLPGGAQSREETPQPDSQSAETEHIPPLGCSITLEYPLLFPCSSLDPLFSSCIVWPPGGVWLPASQTYSQQAVVPVIGSGQFWAKKPWFVPPPQPLLFLCSFLPNINIAILIKIVLLYIFWTKFTKFYQKILCAEDPMLTAVCRVSEAQVLDLRYYNIMLLNYWTSNDLLRYYSITKLLNLTY